MIPKICLIHNLLIYKIYCLSKSWHSVRNIPSNPADKTTSRLSRKTGVTRMKKFAITAAAATALTLTMASGALHNPPRLLRLQ
jgi:hypothetical protein